MAEQTESYNGFTLLARTTPLDSGTIEVVYSAKPESVAAVRVYDAEKDNLLWKGMAVVMDLDPLLPDSEAFALDTGLARARQAILKLNAR
jgi:hypothetical protein